MKRVFFFILKLFLLALFSGGNRDIEAGNMKMFSLPSQARDQAYYSQLEQSGNRYTKDHVWLKNGDDNIEVGIYYFMVSAIGNAIVYIYPSKTVYETIVKGELI